MLKLVVVAKKAKKQIDDSPPQMKTKFKLWMRPVEERGLMEVRKQPGWHDEPLQGKRAEQRSIRLNIKWRAIYMIKDDDTIEFIEVQEVTAHDY